MAQAATFKLVVLQGGADISHLIHADGAEVIAKVRAARTCSYRYNVAGAGPIAPETLIGATVLVSVDTGAGAVTIFTGRINRTPTYLADERQMLVLATDGYQQFLDGKTLAELQQLVPGALYREQLDGNRVSGLQQMQALLSTVTQDGFLDASGSWQLIDWTPKAPGSEDGTVDASVVANATPLLTEGDQLVNRVQISYRHSFTRRVWNRITFAWQYGPGPGFAGWPSWCDWYQTSGHELPLRDMVIEAAQATNWLPIGGIFMEGHPESFGSQGQPALCGPGIGWLLTDYFRTEVIRASWAGGRQYSVEARESLALTVESAGSVAQFGAQTAEMSFAGGTDYPADSADVDKDPQRPAGFIDYGAGNGNQAYKDEIDLSERVADIEAALSKARVQIIGSHRKNSVSWLQLINPQMELGQTWRIDHPLVVATGTLVQLRHRISAVSATTTPTISAFVGGGGVADPLTAPAITMQPPTIGAPPDVFLENKIGGRDTSPDYDPAWEQQSTWIGNHPVTTLDPNKVYQPRFTVVPPDITAEMRQAVELSAAHLYSVEIPATSISLPNP